jgi:protein-disulfide isomerase
MATPADDQRRARLLRLGLIVALAAVVVVIAVVLGSGGGSGAKTATPPAPAGGTPAPSLYAGIPQSGVVLGRPTAKATLIELADLQCPFCREYAVGTMPAVVRDYVRIGKLRYELRIQAFLGPDSARAAGAAAVAARENRLFQFADAFYQQQGQENSGYATDAFIRRIAKAAGVDPAAAVAGAKVGARDPLVRQAEKLAKDIGSGGTPDFYVRLASGRLVAVNPPALAPDAFVPALEQALAQT